MNGDQNQSSSISPWWLLIPAVLLLLLIGLGVGAVYAYYNWRVRSEEARQREVSVPEVEVKQPVGTSTPLPIQVDEPPPVPSTPRPDKPGKTISGGVLNGKAISLPKPAYPPVARAAKASGPVNVEIIIDEEGNVTSATAVSGHALLRPSAVTAARMAKFSPTKLGGVPVKVSGLIIYNFAP